MQVKVHSCEIYELISAINIDAHRYQKSYYQYICQVVYHHVGGDDEIVHFKHNDYRIIAKAAVIPSILVVFISLLLLSPVSLFVIVAYATYLSPPAVPPFQNTAGTVNNQAGFIVPKASNGGITFPPGGGTTTFSFPVWYGVGDFDRDGRDEIVAYHNSDGRWEIGDIFDNEIIWREAGKTFFGNLLDDKHWITIGEFNGDGYVDILFHYGEDGNWWLGTMVDDNNRLRHILTWHQIGDTRGAGLPNNFGNLLDNSHLLIIGDFNKDLRTDIMMHYSTDGNWFVGQLNTNNNQLEWHGAGNTRGRGGSTINFGDLFDGRHAITAGDFTSSGRSNILFHFATDGHWWLGVLNTQTNQLEWNGVGDTHGVGSSVELGDLLDRNSARTVIVGNFDTDHRDDIAVYIMNPGQWMFGTFGRSGNLLEWHPVGTSSFGDLANGQHWITNDFIISNLPYGQKDILFHNSVDGHWFLGVFDSPHNNALSWQKIGDTRGSDATNDFGNLFDGMHELWSGDFDLGGQKILFHHERDGNWFLGTSDSVNKILKWDFLPQYEVVPRR